MSIYKEILEKLREYKELQNFIYDYVDLNIKKVLDNFTTEEIGNNKGYHYIIRDKSNNLNAYVHSPSEEDETITLNSKQFSFIKMNSI